MGRIITVEDLQPFGPEASEAQLNALIDDAEAVAMRLVPCLDAAGDQELWAVAKAVLRRAILRSVEQGSGAVQSMTAGIYGQTLDTRTPASRGIFYPSEEAQLRELCAGSASRGIRVLRTTPSW